MSSYPLGIDLGTSNTCVAIMLDGEPRVVTDERNRSTTPSVMSIDREGKFYVGHVARAQMITNPYGTIHSAKRLIGQKFSSNNVQRAIQYLPFNVVQGPDGGPLCEIGGRRLTPTDISTAVLKKVKRLSEKALGEEVSQAVITVPANFDNAQRRATKEAAERAGLEVLRLLNEPTAASLAYGFGNAETRRVAVYDFGGGTFDISILEIGSDVYEVLSTGGDSYLGGDDFNHRIADHLSKVFRQDTGIDLGFDRIAMQRLLDAAELAKVRLTASDTTEIRLPRIAANIDASVNLDCTLDRRQVEDMCIDLVERSLQICEETFRHARIGMDDIDDFLLVGGMTRMPLVREMVREYFGREPNSNLNPDEVVAIGAAIQAATLIDPQDEILLLDVTPLTLGIESMNGIFAPIIGRNSKVPHRITKRFTTSRDNQDRVRVAVYQGENRYCQENTLLGEFELTGIRRAPRMQPQIDVTFKLDANGILTVTAIDRDTGQEQSIEIVDMAKRALQAMLSGEDNPSPSDHGQFDF
ncbi:MAG: Hsp70 family protein [Myxococcota bacterium]|jgi:molecular chaperone DnaK|nr:Hsp70 family protein [Myxococcota bacterium]